MPTRTARLLPLALALALVAALPATAAAARRPPTTNTISWSGSTWTVKTSASPVGPGPNVFERANVSVDGSGNLRLRIARNAAGTWSSAEVVGSRSLGYGTYEFRLASRVDALDANAVLGLFTWSDRSRYAHREIDIEFARWGNPAEPTNGQFVVQPWDRAGHLHRFAQGPIATSVQRFTWAPGRVDWETRDADGNLVATYTYTGADVPVPGDERVRLNLWLFQGAAPLSGAPVEVLVSSFRFTPPA